MSRATRKLKKLQAKEELKRIKETKKQEKLEKRKQNQQAWDNATPQEKKVVVIVTVIIGAIIFLLIAISAIGGNDTNTPSDKPQEKKSAIAEDVKASLDKLGKDMKQELASTSPDGYQGDITGVESAGNDSVKVKVSTYFNDSGDGVDGGQGIARRIFGMVCFDVPELKSLYVVSDTGLESKSVYRSDIPGCNQ